MEDVVFGGKVGIWCSVLSEDLKFSNLAFSILDFFGAGLVMGDPGSQSIAKAMHVGH